MKKCPKCSKEFTDDIVYCTACNTPLEKVEQTTNTDTKNTQSETAYTQSTQTPQQNTQTTDTSPIQQVPQGNNNPNKKYIITIIIAAITLLFFYLQNVLHLTNQPKKIQLLSQQHLSPNNSRQHPYLLLLPLRNLCQHRHLLPLQRNL